MNMVAQNHVVREVQKVRGVEQSSTEDFEEKRTRISAPGNSLSWLVSSTTYLTQVVILIILESFGVSQH